MKSDVLVLSAIAPRQMAQLEEAYTLHRADEAADREAVIAAAANCEAVVTSGHVTLDRALVDKLPKLKVVACVSAGYESIDVAALNDRGVKLTNSSAALLDDVADCAIMLMLAARRRLIEADAYFRAGKWVSEGAFPLTTAAWGKRVGIAGLGQIGAGIARRCEAMSMQVGYFSRSKKAGVDYPYFADPLSLADWADTLIVATAGGAGTMGLISGQVIAALGPQGCLVNISRGSVVDEPALIAALQSGTLGCAGLDVFATEPTDSPELSALPNVVLYPHHASGTVETRDAMAQSVVDNLAAHFAGKPLLSPVN